MPEAIVHYSSVDALSLLQKRPRDFCWAKEGDVLPLIEHLEQLQVRQSALRLYSTSCMRRKLDARTSEADAPFSLWNTLLHDHAFV